MRPHAQRAAARLHVPLRDRQAKPRTARFARARRVDAVEPFEHTLNLVRRNADAMVDDAHEHLAGIRRADIPRMARHADREANPLYPVPKLMDAQELQRFYERVAEQAEA